SLRVSRDLREVDRWLAPLVAREKTGRGQLDQVLVPGRGGGEQRQMKAIELAGGATGVIIDDVCLAAEDRLDVMLPTGAEQLDGSVHDAVVGQPKRRLIVGCGSFGQLLDLARAVEQGVLGVDVEMRAGGTHSALRA